MGSILETLRVTTTWREKASATRAGRESFQPPWWLRRPRPFFDRREEDAWRLGRERARGLEPQMVGVTLRRS